MNTNCSLLRCRSIDADRTSRFRARRNRVAFALGVWVLGAFTAIPVAQAGKGGGSGGPTPIAVSEFRSLEFADVAVGALGGGTITITTGGGKTVGGTATDMGGNHRAAEFKVTGDANAPIIITLPSSITISNTSGSGSATVSNFTSSPSGATNLDNKGKLTIVVGATLNLPAGANAGNYAGSFTIFVDEQ